MGLAICRRIVERHGGRIEVREGELGGACFSLLLPGESVEVAAEDPGVGIPDAGVDP